MAELTIGTDPPASPSTQGYALNHCALVVYDYAAMRHFYGEILGMRHIMTVNISSAYKVTYMGYPESTVGFQRGEELLKRLRFRDGLLEFLYPIGVEQKKGDQKHGRFSHIGFAVPDVKETHSRLEELGVPILKRLDVETIEPGSRVAEWWGLNPIRAAAIATAVPDIAWGEVLLVEDPDGNIVEVQERK